MKRSLTRIRSLRNNCRPDRRQGPAPTAIPRHVQATGAFLAAGLLVEIVGRVPAAAIHPTVCRWQAPSGRPNAWVRSGWAGLASRV